MTIRQLRGDCRDVLKTLPSESVHCVVTSPPYWGLRDYGTATWEAGDAGCDHVERYPSRGSSTLTSAGVGQTDAGATYQAQKKQFDKDCRKCGARRIDSQLGIEPDFNVYIAEMVAVFREVRRVLRSDGTLWLNLGDSYASSVNGRKAADIVDDDRTFRDKPFGTVVHGLFKPKDLCGIPWRVAFALQADGWWLRQDIIWSKPNPMPESVTDRCTKAHEYIFLMSKNARYYYDAEAIREPVKPTNLGDVRMPEMDGYRSIKEGYAKRRPQREVGYDEIKGANKRSVWEVATAPFSEAHFATFPPALIEPCIKAGTSEKGCCAKCGAPQIRQVNYHYEETDRKPAPNKGKLGAFQERAANMTRDGFIPNREKIATHGGWLPSCSCGATAIPCTILDPFGGAGTTGLVADRLQRNSILIELNPEYAAMAEHRVQNDAGMFAEIAAE